MQNIALGPFRLDKHNDLLLRGTEPVALGRRAVLLLKALVERPGTLVTKDALIDAAWAGQAVEESNLNVQIAALRRVLGAAPGGTRWIETMPRRGYRFVGPVVAEEHKGSMAAAKQVDAVPGAPALPDKPSIALLPFQNMSDDPGQEYFVDGMVEEIITALSRIRWLFVLARNSSFTYKGQSPDVRQVANSACATCSKARFARAAIGCASRRS